MSSFSNGQSGHSSAKFSSNAVARDVRIGKSGRSTYSTPGCSLPFSAASFTTQAAIGKTGRRAERASMWSR